MLSVRHLPSLSIHQREKRVHIIDMDIGTMCSPVNSLINEQSTDPLFISAAKSAGLDNIARFLHPCSVHSKHTILCSYESHLTTTNQTSTLALIPFCFMHQSATRGHHVGQSGILQIPPLRLKTLRSDLSRRKGVISSTSPAVFAGIEHMLRCLYTGMC